MFSLYQPTGIEALNKHLEQVVSPPWKLKNWFLSDDDLFKEAQKDIEKDKSIEAYLLGHYDKFTLTFELSRAEILLNKFYFPEYLSEVGSLIIGIIVGLASLICSLISPIAVLSFLIIVIISFIGCDIIIYQRRKLKRAILILESCLISFIKNINLVSDIMFDKILKYIQYYLAFLVIQYLFVVILVSVLEISLPDSLKILLFTAIFLSTGLWTYWYLKAHFLIK